MCPSIRISLAIPLILTTLTEYYRINGHWELLNAEQKHLGYKKGEASQKQQLSDYNNIAT